MDYKKIVYDEYTIHFIQTKKFHTIDFDIIFTENANKRKVTYRNALIDIMSYCTKKYDTTKKLIQKCQELYSLKPIMYNVRMGNLLKTKFSISVINSKYVSDENILDNILLLKEIILNPYVDCNGFNQEKLAIVKRKIITQLNLLKESPRAYANYKALELLGDGTNYNLTNYSDLEVLNEITPQNLYDSYLEMLKNSTIDIFIAGDIKNEDEIIKVIKENFHFKNRKEMLMDPYTHHKMCGKKPNSDKEIKPFNQSKLTMIYKMCDVSDFESRYILNLFNSILGGNENCLLMRYIREKNSLCYYANSFFNKLDNILVVNVGINSNNYDRVVLLVKEVIKKMQNGKFSNVDIKTAKLSVLEEYETLNSSNTGLIEYYYGRELFNGDDMITRKENLRMVTKKDIIELAGKAELSSIFFLEGDL